MRGFSYKTDFRTNSLVVAILCHGSYCRVKTAVLIRLLQRYAQSLRFADQAGVSLFIRHKVGTRAKTHDLGR